MSNLCILLNGQSTSFTTLPKNKDALKILQNTSPNESTYYTKHEVKLEAGQICVTLWRENGIETWYVGYCVEVNEKIITVEHIHRTEKDSNLKWKYPTKSDIIPIEDDQILDCEIHGNWNILSNRKSGFILTNHEEIQFKFLEAKHLI